MLTMWFLLKKIKEMINDANIFSIEANGTYHFGDSVLMRRALPALLKVDVGFGQTRKYSGIYEGRLKSS